MAWDEIQNQLYTGEKDGDINVWTLDRETPEFILG